MTPLFAMMALNMIPSLSHAGQADSQAEARAAYAQAADDSLRASALEGMRAFTRLGQGNLLGAYRSGVAAFGAYDRGGKLDDAGSAAALKAHAMGDGKDPAPRPVKTTFSRLDPSFLKEGEAAGVVAEFEKVTGIRSGNFLRRLGDASDHPVEWSDPKLGSKLLSRINAASVELKDGAFKTTFRGALKMFPASWIDQHPGEAKKKLEAAVEGKAGLTEFLALSGSKAPLVASAPADLPAPKVDAPMEKSPSAQVAEEAPAPAQRLRPYPERLPASPAMVAKAGGINVAFMKDMLREQVEADSSLFTRVRRRYQSAAIGLSL